MWRLRKKRIHDDDALALRPARLPAVEDELARPRPRPFVWAAREISFGRITDEMRALLVDGTAVRAWVTRYVSRKDSEGTDHLVQYCFETAGGLVHGVHRAGFDDYHLVVGSSDYARWLHGAFCEAGTFTVIHPSRGKPVPVIYGTMELYIEQDLVEVADALGTARDPETIDGLARRFLDIALSPSAIIMDGRQEYHDLYRRIGLVRGHERPRRDENLEIIRSAIRQGRYESRDLEALAGICRRYGPGIWAAT
jgi:hypothetical protein